MGKVPFLENKKVSKRFVYIRFNFLKHNIGNTVKKTFFQKNLFLCFAPWICFWKYGPLKVKHSLVFELKLKNGSFPRGAANMALHKIQKSAKSTHPTVQCTQDTSTSKVHTHPAQYVSFSILSTGAL